jgi:hypothetical protein
MIPVEITPGMAGEWDEGEWWRRGIQVSYI